MKKVVLITGTSTGIGLHTAVAFAQAGHTVYGTMRNLAKADALRQACREAGVQVQQLALDVQELASVQAAVEAVARAEGRIDVVVNNAGQGFFRTAEQATDEEVAALFDVNFAGNNRVVRAVLPIMRAQGSGHIIGITSVGGLVGQPINELYCASKFALEGYYESLATYLKPYFGIDVSVIEPGGVSTEFVGNIMANLQATGGMRDDAYKPVVDAYMTPRGAYSLQTPQEIAQVILACASHPAPPLRMRTSEWGEAFCRFKTEADPDGTRQTAYVRQALLGK